MCKQVGRVLNVAAGLVGALGLFQDEMEGHGTSRDLHICTLHALRRAGEVVSAVMSQVGQTSRPDLVEAARARFSAYLQNKGILNDDSSIPNWSDHSTAEIVMAEMRACAAIV